MPTFAGSAPATKLHTDRIHADSDPMNIGCAANKNGLHMSPSIYFICVALATALAIGVMMLFRPAFAYTVRDLVGLAQHTVAKPGSFFSVRVTPILEENCVECHGNGRQKANLRLDSYAAVLRGGKNGPVVRPGNPGGSVLLSRVGLPATNDEVMPPSGKPPLSAGDTTVLRLWIAHGASGDLSVSAFKDAPPPVVRVVFPEVDAAAVERARAGESAVVQKLMLQYPNVLAYRSRISVDMNLDASRLRSTFGNADLRQFAPLSNHIVMVDLSGTAVTDSSVRIVLGMKNVRDLHLNNLVVNDETIRALRSLHALQTLTLVGTSVNKASFLALKASGVRVYDGNE